MNDPDESPKMASMRQQLEDLRRELQELKQSTDHRIGDLEQRIAGVIEKHSELFLLHRT